jgi:hypothetical protein
LEVAGLRLSDFPKDYRQFSADKFGTQNCFRESATAVPTVFSLAANPFQAKMTIGCCGTPAMN